MNKETISCPELKYRANILPDFLIIGGMKCGTTSLHYYLQQHPEICMSQEKELNFFITEKNWAKGIDWYQSHFKGIGKIYGESSPNYTNFPIWKGVPQRIHQVKPDLKLIYILRDPIERILSQYIHYYADNLEDLSFEQAIFNENRQIRYVTRSLYYSQLEKFLPYFPLEQIFVTTIEELSTDPESTLKSIVNFLGVNDDISMIKNDRILHKSKFKRRNNKIGNLIKNSPINQAILALPPPFRDHLQKLVYFPFSSVIHKPQLNPEIKTKLIDLLQDDVNQLRKLTGKSFSHWSL